MNTQRRSEGGQALVLLVLALVGLLGFTALAVDGGMVYSDRRNAQNAADTAAMAGALAKIKGQDWYQKALDRAASNHYVKGGTATDVQVYDPPINGPYAGKDEYIQVIITSTVNTSFAQFVFGGPLRNTVEAVAHAKPGSIGPMFPGQAMVGLAPNGCSVFWTHGTANSTLQNGGIFVNSNDPTCAFQLSGGAGTLTAESVTVVGGAEGQPDLTNVNVPPGAFTVGYQPPYDYPPKFQVPTPVCTDDASVSGNTMSPGNWSGQFPPAHVTKLDPGIYCVSGNFRMNGGDTLEGTDILIYQISGDIYWNGGATINLSAKNTGMGGKGEYPYDGLLIYVDPRNYVNVPNCTITLDGSSDTHITGTVYAPSCEINVLGTGGADAYHSQVIGYTIELGGTEDLNLVYNEDENAPWFNPSLISDVQ